MSAATLAAAKATKGAGPYHARTARERNARQIVSAQPPRQQHKRPAPIGGQPVVNRFDPTRALACDAVCVPYGAVAVDGKPGQVRSFEMRLDKRDGSCFLPPSLPQPAPRDN